jgi:hypothetical protein
MDGTFTRKYLMEGLKKGHPSSHFCIRSLMTCESPYENTPPKFDPAIVGPQFPNLFVRIVALNDASCEWYCCFVAHICERRNRAHPKL